MFLSGCGGKNPNGIQGKQETQWQSMGYNYLLVDVIHVVSWKSHPRMSCMDGFLQGGATAYSVILPALWLCIYQRATMSW